MKRFSGNEVSYQLQREPDFLGTETRLSQESNPHSGDFPDIDSRFFWFFLSPKGIFPR